MRHGLPFNILTIVVTLAAMLGGTIAPSAMATTCTIDDSSYPATISGSGLVHCTPGEDVVNGSRGVDTIVCMSVNDAFVMSAWGKAQNAEELMMLAAGNGDFTKALGLELDGRGFGLGTRSQRFAMIVENGKVTHLNVEPGPGVDVSSADTMMGLL